MNGMLTLTLGATKRVTQGSHSSSPAARQAAPRGTGTNQGKGIARGAASG